MKYGYEDGLRGVEAEYRVTNERVLQIEILGSNHPRDYLQNLLAWPREKTAYGKVHSRWLDMAAQLWLHILGDGEVDPYDSVLITGHSMGGAIGAILSRFPRCPVSLITINAPKCGDWEYMKNLKERVTVKAMFDRGDIVRHLPFFYAKYPNPFQYDNTTPFWRAHNNFPKGVM